MTLRLWANDLPTLYGKAAELELTFDNTAAENGDKRQRTIKRVQEDAKYLGTVFIVFAGSDIGHTHPIVGFAAQ